MQWSMLSKKNFWKTVFCKLNKTSQESPKVYIQTFIVFNVFKLNMSRSSPVSIWSPGITIFKLILSRSFRFSFMTLFLFLKAVITAVHTSYPFKNYTWYIMLLIMVAHSKLLRPNYFTKYGRSTTQSDVERIRNKLHTLKYTA